MYQIRLSTAFKRILSLNASKIHLNAAHLRILSLNALKIHLNEGARRPDEGAD